MLTAEDYTISSSDRFFEKAITAENSKNFSNEFSAAFKIVRSLKLF